MSSEHLQQGQQQQVDQRSDVGSDDGHRRRDAGSRESRPKTDQAFQTCWEMVVVTMERLEANTRRLTNNHKAMRAANLSIVESVVVYIYTIQFRVGKSALFAAKMQLLCARDRTTRCREVDLRLGWRRFGKRSWVLLQIKKKLKDEE